MDDEKLNISVRRYLKKVGISSQRSIEETVREKIKSGELKSSQKIKITAKISSNEIGLDENIDGEIEI